MQVMSLPADQICTELRLRISNNRTSPFELKLKEFIEREQK